MEYELQEGFEQGNHDNLPKVDSFMVYDYLSNNLKFTTGDIDRWKHIKRSKQETYGDDAVGYVQVQRIGDNCTVKAIITTKHDIKSRVGSCTLVCDEKQEAIISVDCYGCTCASRKGGCKHGIAFLMWLHRRSEELSPTEKSYWVKPKLAAARTSVQFIKAKDIGSSLTYIATNDQNEKMNSENGDRFLQAVVQKLQENSVKNQLSVYFNPMRPFKNLSLHSLIFEYKKGDSVSEKAEDFITYCSKQMTMEECRKGEEATLCQSKSALWHELEYCRITASKVYETAYYKVMQNLDDLVEEIFGVPLETADLERAKRFGPEVRAVVSKTRNAFIESCGIFLKPDSPVLCASPDGLTSEFVVVIKLPMTKREKENFVKYNVLTKKSKAEIQLLMFFCDKEKGLYCVADENFKDNKTVDIFEEHYDKDYCMDLIKKSMQFWEKNVFPILID